MALRFVTGNANKLAEARVVFPDIEQLDIDLPEIQEIDPQAIIAAKLQEALRVVPDGNIVVEDTALYIDSLGGLPGPLIKWFQKSIGIDGIARMATAMGDDRAEARVTLGYANANGTIEFFEGSLRGRIVAPRGETRFGWDPIFQPGGEVRTFAEMSQREKDQISMRRIAFEKLRQFLK